jgi:hypothetical protein
MLTAEGLVEKIFAPFVVGATHQAHDMAAGVEVEGTRFAHQLHAGFNRQLISLLAVAEVTAGDQVLPGRKAAAGTGDNMIERQLT